MDRRRALMMAQGGGGVQGTELQWIKCDGHQAIDLGVYPYANTNVKIWVSGPAGTGFNYMFCAEENIGGKTFHYYAILFSQPYLGYGTKYVRGAGFKDPGMYEINEGKLYVTDSNGVQTLICDLSSETMPQYTSKTLTAFSENNSDVSAHCFGNNNGGNFVYAMQVFDGATLIRDMIPFETSDGDIGMLDQCGSICPYTGTNFYPNTRTLSDTTPFIAGPPKED